MGSCPCPVPVPLVLLHTSRTHPGVPDAAAVSLRSPRCSQTRAPVPAPGHGPCDCGAKPACRTQFPCDAAVVKVGSEPGGLKASVTRPLSCALTPASPHQGAQLSSVQSRHFRGPRTEHGPRSASAASRRLVRWHGEEPREGPMPCGPGLGASAVLCSVAVGRNEKAQFPALAG